MTHRKKWDKFEQIEMGEKLLINAKNPPGMLTNSIFKACSAAISQSENVTIFVDGEEDLVPIPLILMALYSLLLF